MCILYAKITLMSVMICALTYTIIYSTRKEETPSAR